MYVGCFIISGLSVFLFIYTSLHFVRSMDDGSDQNQKHNQLYWPSIFVYTKNLTLVVTALNAVHAGDVTNPSQGLTVS